MQTSDPRTPRIDRAEIGRILSERYGLEGEIGGLPSYIDRNFSLRNRDGRWVVKIANSEETRASLDFESGARQRVAAAGIACGDIVPDREGETIATITLGDKTHLMRVVTYVPGTFMAEMDDQPPGFLEDLGRAMARIDRALADYRHPGEDRVLSWDLARAAEVRPMLRHIEDTERRDSVTGVLDRFEAEVLSRAGDLPHSVIHNDGNDHNILVEGHRVSGIIDFGDMCRTWRVSEPAIAIAYAILDKPDPLIAAASVVRGYNAVVPLEEAEIAVLFDLIRTRLAVSVAHSARQRAREPENAYISVSEQAAWTALDRLATVHPTLAQAVFRTACGLEGHPRTRAVTIALLDATDQLGPLVRPPIDDALILDFGPHGRLGRRFAEDGDSERFTREIFSHMGERGAVVALGRYNEHRPFYTAPAFQGEHGGEPRTVHLGADLFLEPGSPVFAPLDGVVHATADNAARLDYGPTIILAHRLAGETFYTLYGHLDERSLKGLEPGTCVVRGQTLGMIGDRPRNGDWPPHLHFQITLDLLGCQGDFPGVAQRSLRQAWLDLCPDPNLIMGHPDFSDPAREPKHQLRARRLNRLGRMLSLAYREPLKMVRGRGAYLYDHTGRCFLDMVNNVCHVGHCHPRVVAAATAQIATLNTNTRYLHDTIVDYAERLTETLPDSLAVVFLVNSGSEANDLALRLARTHTGGSEVVALDHAYHGHLSSLIEISAYKFNRKGGEGPGRHVHIAELPDTYRGPYRTDDPAAAEKYAASVADAVAAAGSRERGLSCFIHESVPGCGGQIVFPDGYLKRAYAHVREKGGVCIADEVQVGFGRVGSHMWAFETQGVVPDIVTLGKPIGNGHPMAAVVTTPAIAQSFETGMEYFNTFGGNPVSNAIGLAVLDVIGDEGLQANAAEVGADLLAKLRSLAARFPVIGDVRGLGLFIGIELTRDPETREPAPELATYIVNRLVEEDILVSIDGPDENVLKLKPPLCFSHTNAATFIDRLAEILTEPEATYR